MWIKHMPSGDLINLELMKRVYKDKVKIFGEYPDGSRIVLGEFWTTRECDGVFRGIQLGIGDEYRCIFVKDTRDGMKKIKRGS